MVGNFISLPLMGIETASSDAIISVFDLQGCCNRVREREMVVAHPLCLSPVKHSQSVGQNKSYGPNPIASEMKINRMMNAQ